MPARPFKTQAYDELAEEFDGNLQVFVRLRGGVGLPQPLHASMDRPFRDLALAGAWGALAGDAADPSTSTMALLISAQVVDGQELLWSFAADGIHPGTLRVIENLVHWLHLHVAAVDRLRIHSSLVAADGAMPADLPADHEPCPFAFEYGAENSDVLVDVEFAERVDVALLQPVRPAWAAWEGLAAQGGFCDAQYPPRELNLCVEDELRLTSTGLGANYERVAIADAGFLCLVNLLQAVHRRVAAIESVVIE